MVSQDFMDAVNCTGLSDSGSSDRRELIGNFGKFLNILFSKKLNYSNIVLKKNLLINYSDPYTSTSDVYLQPNEQNLFGKNKRNLKDILAATAMNNFRWLLPRSLQRRIIFKNGECNISLTHIDRRSRHYLADFFTTLIDLKWRINLVIFVTTFASSWIFFGFIWWCISYLHNDFENYGKQGWKSCVNEVYDFPSAFLFSIETQQTIGYGYRNVTPHCPAAIVTLMIQTCFGIVVQALMTGLVFAKLSRPKKRAQTLMFSQKAVVCERDGQLCLMFRVGDMRKSQIIEAHVRAIMVTKRITQEGEILPFHQKNIKLETSDEEGRLFLIWPATVEHKIDQDSPLWDISANDLIHRHFEIMVILEGIVESTGMTTQARTSYLPSEIMWGYRFDQAVSYKAEEGHYVVDFSQLNSTTPVAISAQSAKERHLGSFQRRKSVSVSKLDEIYKVRKSLCVPEGDKISCDIDIGNDDQSKIVTADAATRIFNIIGVTSLAPCVGINRKSSME